MSVTYRAFSDGSILNIYKLPETNSFNPETMVVKQSSATKVVFEATFQGILVRSESSGIFPEVPAVGTSVKTLINGSGDSLISSESVYVNNKLIETIEYSNSVSGKDSFNASSDASSNLYKKIYSGNDIFIGSVDSAEDDKADGYDGNDLFNGYGGSSDLFNGGNGIDTSVYRGKLLDYVLTKNISFWNPSTLKNDLTGLQVVDKTTGRDGTDGLVNVERLKFSDTNVALDVGPTQNAGSVYMLYKAAFNRAPDAGGMGYWLAQKDGGSNIVTNIAQGFVASKEFTDKYGTNPTNASYVDKLYQNVLGRAGESGGVTYWNQELDAGRISKAAVLVQFATLPEGAALVANLIANGIQYQEWVG
jgi:hypothetical protein